MTDHPRRSAATARASRDRAPGPSKAREGPRASTPAPIRAAAAPSPAPRLHFDAAYRELARLRDGATVLLRAVVRSDKDLLRRGFARLSPRSRYLRFLSPKTQLSDAELDKLVSLDGVDRFALGARAILADGQEGEGLGIARFARLPDRPAAAEAAVTVIDEAQGKGLGTLLVQRLACAARERGIDRFVCEFNAGNEHIRHLVARFAPGAEVLAQGYVRAEVPLPALRPDDPLGAIDREGLAYGLLAGSARREVAVRLRRLHPGASRPRMTPAARGGTGKRAQARSSSAPRRAPAPAKGAKARRRRRERG